MTQCDSAFCGDWVFFSLSTLPGTFIKKKKILTWFLTEFSEMQTDFDKVKEKDFYTLV